MLVCRDWLPRSSVCLASVIGGDVGEPLRTCATYSQAPVQKPGLLIQETALDFLATPRPLPPGPRPQGRQLAFEPCGRFLGRSSVTSCVLAGRNPRGAAALARLVACDVREERRPRRRADRRTAQRDRRGGSLGRSSRGEPSERLAQHLEGFVEVRSQALDHVVDQRPAPRDRLRHGASRASYEAESSCLLRHRRRSRLLIIIKVFQRRHSGTMPLDGGKDRILLTVDSVYGRFGGGGGGEPDKAARPATKVRREVSMGKAPAMKRPRRSKLTSEETRNQTADLAR